MVNGTTISSLSVLNVLGDFPLCFLCFWSIPREHESARLLGPPLGCFVVCSPNGDHSPGLPIDSRLPKHKANLEEVVRVQDSSHGYPLKVVARGLGSSHGDHLKKVARV